MTLPRWVHAYGLEPKKVVELGRRLTLVGDYARMMARKLRAAADETDRVLVVKHISGAAEAAGLLCYSLEYIAGMLDAQLARERRDNPPRTG